MRHLTLLIILALAASASVVALDPGVYAISSVPEWRWSPGLEAPCLGFYLAYDVKGTSTDVYLIPSATSHPPLWRVDPVPDSPQPGAFRLTAVNRTAQTPTILTYKPGSCSDSTVSLSARRNSTWVNISGVLQAVRPGCPSGSALTLAPVQTAGLAACRAVHLSPSGKRPPARAMMWHFSRWPGPPTELFSGNAANSMLFLGGPVAMDDNLLVQGTFHNHKLYPTFWRRRAGGVWRRGHLKVPNQGTMDDALDVAMGDDFVAILVSVTSDGETHVSPYWRVYVWNKTTLNKEPVAVLDGARTPGKIVVSMVAGGDNLAVIMAWNTVVIWTVNKQGKWRQTATLTTPEIVSDPDEPRPYAMSRDGSTLALVESPPGSFNLVVYRRVRSGGAWVRTAKLPPPLDTMDTGYDPRMALSADRLVALCPSAPGDAHSLCFYRRSSAGIWSLMQSVNTTGGVASITGDGDLVVTHESVYVVLTEPATPWTFVYRRSSTTGLWARVSGRPLPSWDDRFMKSAGAWRYYGDVAMHGKRYALTARFVKDCWGNQQYTCTSRTSPGIVYIYEDIEKL